MGWAGEVGNRGSRDTLQNGIRLCGVDGAKRQHAGSSSQRILAAHAMSCVREPSTCLSTLAPDRPREIDMQRTRRAATAGEPHRGSGRYVRDDDISIGPKENHRGCSFLRRTPTPTFPRAPPCVLARLVCGPRRPVHTTLAAIAGLYASLEPDPNVTSFVCLTWSTHSVGNTS